MEDEVNLFQELADKILYLVGWIIRQITNILRIAPPQSGTIVRLYSPLIVFFLGLSFIFGIIYIFKRILRKG